MSWYDDLQPDGRNEYGAPFFKYTELDHGWSAELFGQIIWLLYRPARVVEFGCGIGATCTELYRHGVDVLPVDVSEDCRPFIARRSDEVARRLVVADLSRPMDNQPTGYDMAVSVEVLEHLPESGAQNAVDTIAASAPLAIVTACPPTGRNPLHPNEQPFPYWIEKFNRAGMTLDEVDTKALQATMRGLSMFRQGLPAAAGQRQVVPGWYFNGYLGVFRRGVAS